MDPATLYRKEISADHAMRMLFQKASKWMAKQKAPNARRAIVEQ
jgi:hypothetical protein